MDPLAEKYPSTEIKCEPGIEDKMDSSAVTEGDPDELFCDFEAVSDLIKKDDDDIKCKDEWDHAQSQKRSLSVYAATTASSLKKHKGSGHELFHNKQAEISDKSLLHTPDTIQVIKKATNSTMTHEAVNAFAFKEEISEVVEETSTESVKESHSSVMQEESGSVVVFLPVKDEDITEVKEETQDPLLMAGGWYVGQYILMRRGD